MALVKQKRQHYNSELTGDGFVALPVDQSLLLTPLT
jgi:hypothetical protein